MAIINIEMTEFDLRALIREHLSKLVGFNLDNNDIKIEVKSKQNYKSEWEKAEFRVTVLKSIPPS